MERGLLTKQSYKYCTRIVPPINITYEDCNMIYEIFKYVLDAIVLQTGYKNDSKVEYNHFHSDKEFALVTEYLKTRTTNPIVYLKENKRQTEYEVNCNSKPTMKPPVEAESMWKSVADQIEMNKMI